MNGQRSYNPYTQLYGGDLVFIANLVKNVKAVPHTKGFSSYTGGVSGLNFHSSTYLSITNGNSPEYLEVDELTSAFLVLFEPQRWGM